ncbi:MAG: MotE family protein [Rhizomicrobium sp.]
MKVRLLPTVLALGASLLVLKGTDVTMEARAAAAAPLAVPAPAQQAPAPSADPAADDAQATTTGEVDVLTSLAKRRAALDARDQSLDLRENLIKAAEQRVDGKIGELKQLQTQVQALLVQRDDAEQKQLTALVKTYSSMKPKDAARIFNSLDPDVLLNVASQTKPDVLSAILSGMQPEQAQKLTVRLADRLKLPATPAPSQQLAAAAPPPSAAPPGVAPQASPVPAAQAAASTPSPASPAPQPVAAPNTATAPTKK